MNKYCIARAIFTAIAVGTILDLLNNDSLYITRVYKRRRIRKYKTR